MASVVFSGYTNSTLFTTCCNVAICDDQSCCPYCKEEVPFTPKERWDIAMIALYGRKRLAKMQQGYKNQLIEDF